MSRASRLATLGLLVALAPAACAAGFRVTGLVLGNGGTDAAAVGTRVLGTVGQVAIGSSGGTGQLLRHGFWSSRDADLAGVGALPFAPLPPSPELGPASPNPTRGEVTFAVALPRPGRVRLEVFDLAGRSLGRTADVRMDAGQRTLRWAAPDVPTAKVATGLYYARLVVDGQPAATRRFVVLK